MCGLFGWNTREDANPVKKRVVAAVLSVFNDERGGDSWGFFGNNTRGVVKGLGMAINMTQKQLNLLSRQTRVVGHTRKATTGVICKANAHPFDMGAVVGAHNGIVFNHKQLNEFYRRDCQVDSQHIFAHLEAGIIDFSDIQAYGAITFMHRSHEERVFAGSFNQGQLAIAEVKNFGTVWSSDMRHLKNALKAAELFDDAGFIEYLLDDELVSITPERMEYEGTHLDFDNPWKHASKSVMVKTGNQTDIEPEEWENLEDYRLGMELTCADCGEYMEMCGCYIKG